MGTLPAALRHEVARAEKHVSIESIRARTKSIADVHLYQCMWQKVQ